MNPFDMPPSGEPVTSHFAVGPTPPPPAEPPRRGRMALVALLTAGLVGAGLAGVGALASADRPETATPAVSPGDETTDEGTAGEGIDDVATSDESTGGATDDGSAEFEGEIRFDDGDGDPIVVPLDELDEEAIDRLQECMGFPEFDVTWGELSEVEPGELPFGDLEAHLDELFGELLGEDGSFGAHVDDLFAELAPLADGSVTVTGPDGVSVVDLGENGSVTVTKEDGEVTIATDGDATVTDVDDLFGGFGPLLPPGGHVEGEFEFGDFDEWLEQWAEEAPNLEFLPPADPAEVQSCIDEVLGN